MKFAKLPKHVAVIMDGNGRWAEARGLSRSEGHREGALAVDRLLETALKYKIQAVSLYAFSTENWKRPVTEVRSIFQLLIEFIDTRLPRIQEKGIRIIHSGSKSKISAAPLKKIEEACHKTVKNKKLVANFCLNYGAKEELLSSFGRLQKARKAAGKSLETPPTEKELEKYLYTHPLPPVDLLIRTAGEKRVSNFLLWQIAYAELFFTDTLWPDFGTTAFEEALSFYESRKRKFGGLL